MRRRLKDDTKVNVTSGMNFTGWLTLLFVGLKLTGYITWSWFWVLSPIWISLSIVAVSLIIFLIIYYFLYK